MWEEWFPKVGIKIKNDQIPERCRCGAPSGNCAFRLEGKFPA
jgi:hypothetical protein